MQHLGYAVVGTCCIQSVLHVMLAEGGIGRLELRVRSPIGNGTLHQLAHTIANKAAHVVNSVLRQTILAQGIVD